MPPLLPVLPLTSRQTLRGSALWKRLKHPNIVPFLGVTTDPPQLISDWMPNGNVVEYMQLHPDADRLGLVCPPFHSAIPHVHTFSAI